MFLTVFLIKEQEEFLLYLNGKTETAITAFKAHQDVFVECAHTIVPPENGLIDATGGVLTNSNELVAIVCGGAKNINNDDKPNGNCIILNQDKSSLKLTANGNLNHFRSGSASAVIDNGHTLWVTGGKLESDTAHRTTELVAFATDIPFETNAVGPLLPVERLPEHCVVVVGPKVAVFTGGANLLNGYEG